MLLYAVHVACLRTEANHVYLVRKTQNGIQNFASGAEHAVIADSLSVGLSMSGVILTKMFVGSPHHVAGRASDVSTPYDSSTDSTKLISRSHGAGECEGKLGSIAVLNRVAATDEHRQRAAGGRGSLKTAAASTPTPRRGRLLTPTDENDRSTTPPLSELHASSGGRSTIKFTSSYTR